MTDPINSTSAAGLPWRVGEFVSSANRPEHVLMLAVGEKQIAEYGAHRDFVRWVADAAQIDALRIENERLKSDAQEHSLQYLSDNGQWIEEAADQARDARAQALEDAARVCECTHREFPPVGDEGTAHYLAVTNCAAAIRALAASTGNPKIDALKQGGETNA